MPRLGPGFPAGIGLQRHRARAFLFPDPNSTDFES